MKRLLISIAILLLCLGVSLFLQWSSAFSENGINEMLKDRSVLSQGDTARLKHVMARALRGEDIVIGIIGGSITGGTGAKQIKDRWGNLLYRWWKERFPRADITFVNAGIGGTGSNYGAHRIQRDLLKYRPDFVVAEFAVNDRNTVSSAQTLEGLTRQILKGPHSPALMFLFMSYEDGRSAQEWHSKVGKHYSIPMISYGDAIKYAIHKKWLKWKNVSIDQVHPNNRGHRYCAEFIIGFLEKTLADMHVDNALPEIDDKMVAPFINNAFEFTRIYDNKTIKPVTNTGWYDFRSGWKSDKPGSEIVFEVTGTVVSIMYNRNNAIKRSIEVIVDDRPPVRLDGWFFRPWTLKQFDFVASNLEQGRHKVRVKLLNDTDNNGKGHGFEIREIMVAGIFPDSQP